MVPSEMNQVVIRLSVRKKWNRRFDIAVRFGELADIGLKEPLRCFQQCGKRRSVREDCGNHGFKIFCVLLDLK